MLVFSLQADELPDIPPQTVTEEQYTDEHGNMVVKKVKPHTMYTHVFQSRVLKLQYNSSTSGIY